MYKKQASAHFEFIYLILSHHKVPQLLRLVRRLRYGSPDSAVVIHHDPKGPPISAEMLNDIPNVYLVKDPVSVTLYDWTQAEALLHSIGYISDRFDFAWLSVISGQDYPLKPLAAIEHELRETAFDAFVEAYPVSKYDLKDYAHYFSRFVKLPRFPYYYRFPGAVRQALHHARMLFQTNWRLPIRIEGADRGTPLMLGIRSWRTPFSNSFICYKGSDWFTLSRQAVQYLLDFSHNNASILRYFRRTRVPCEAFFQTVLLNCGFLRICGDNRRFILWESVQSTHPKTLTIHDLELMRTSGKDFGRKFDMDVDSRVMDVLDDLIARA